MKISKKDWQKYIAKLRNVNERAADRIAEYIRTHDISTEEGLKALLDYSYAVATEYGEAATELACQMYDAVAQASGVNVPAAEPAATATYGETARAVKGKMFDTVDPDAVAASVGRLVKTAGVDTTMQNALRDGAEWAWIPSGDTCAFCLMLASNGWQRASKDAIKNGHAEHIHPNCDCTYQIRFDGKTSVEGYDPDSLYDEYAEAGKTRQERLNAIRRRLYSENPEYFRAQKRAAYAKRHGTLKANNSIVSIQNFEKAHWKDSTESGLLIKHDGTEIPLGGVEHHVQGDKSLIEEMAGGTFTHNHPIDTTFSTNDMRTGVASGNLKEMRAVTSKGTVHILTNNGASIEDRRKFNTMYAEAERKFKRIATEKKRRHEIDDIESYVEKRKEKWLSENAPIYGYEYKKESLK